MTKKGKLEFNGGTYPEVFLTLQNYFNFTYEIIEPPDGNYGTFDEDLQDLSRDRGMRAIGLTRERLEKQYQDWIELSCDPNISVSSIFNFMFNDFINKFLF